MQTLISHIERCSSFDGPGIRTVVFFKGCPLSCKWCHNPECISFEKEELFYPEKCIKCGRCQSGCVTGARVVCGRIIPVHDVVVTVKRDEKYYSGGGGVTLSGGEPLAHNSYVNELIDALLKENIDVAIETSMFKYDEEILKKVDRIMADVKIFDEKKHLEYVGISGEKIRDNILKADLLGVPLTIRTPIIKGINDDEQNVRLTAEFASSLKNCVRYELLPYHAMGVNKARALGKEQKVFSAPDAKTLENLKKYQFTR